MTREELREHCIRQIEQIEMWAKYKGEKPSGKVYEEHKLILELLEQEPKIGHWIYDYTSADGHRVYHCSECGCYLKPKTSEFLSDYKWCSLCGRRMVETQKSEG